MITRFLKPLKDKSYFLFGPRGTGKSTWLKATYGSIPSLDLLKESVFQEFLRDPSRLEDWALGHPHYDPKKRLVIIDEIQRLPVLLNEVHRLIENRSIRFIMTGSSARKLKREGANLLAGRALLKQMHPLSAAELGPLFDLKKSLRFGQLPKAYTTDEPKEFLKSYVGVYLREEVQMEAQVRNLAQFSRFLEAAAFSQASVISVAKIAQDCGVDRKTAENYTVLLEDLLLAVRVPVFLRRAKRKLTNHPKFYYFDTGVYQTLRQRGPLDSEDEISGAALETLVFQELRAEISNRDLDLQMYFWRSQKKEEVDFILYGEGGFIGIEVTKSSRVRKEDLTSLQEFNKDYPEAKCFFLYAGKEHLKIGSIHCIPLTDCFGKWEQILISNPKRR